MACEKDKEFALTTLSINNEVITPAYNSADVRCSFKTDATISDAYVQYSLSSSFAKYEVAKMTEEKGIYTAQLVGLADNTTYYIRYEASNKYSRVVTMEVKAFTTKEKTTSNPSDPSNPSEPVVVNPTVTTKAVTEVTLNSAIVSGEVTADGGASVTERGACVATVSNPTVANTKITAGSGVGEFTCELTGLQEGTKYYVRAYAVNSKGTAYGEEVVFTTPVAGVPTVTTTQPSSITETTAVAGGNVTNDGGISVTERGVVYSLSAHPSISDLSSTIVRSGSGTGAFTCNLSNLQAGTTYYVRAYAINNKGTAYGDEVSFTTALPISLATVTTASITNITETTAKAGGTVTNDGNAAVTERGVCISTVSNPTTSNTKITAGSGTGSFTCNLTGLQANTTYYVRAYAVNSKGTAYGKHNQGVKCKLLLLGKGTTQDMKILDKISGINFIEYKGFVSDEELNETMKRCDILCMTRINSRFANYGFPFKLSEYLATGNILLATNVGDVCQYLEDKVSALIVEPESPQSIADAIRFVEENHEKSLKIAQTGHKVMKDVFNIDCIGKKFINFLESI